MFLVLLLLGITTITCIIYEYTNFLYMNSRNFALALLNQFTYDTGDNTVHEVFPSDK